MSAELDYQLSPAGRSRREAMLSDLTGMMRRTHRARKLRRRTVGAAALGLAIVAAARLAFVGLHRPESVPSLTEKVFPAPLQSSEVNLTSQCVISRVATDPAILDRLRARPSGQPALLDDHALITALAQLDRPAGLIRTHNSIRLSAPVTNAELGLKQ